MCVFNTVWEWYWSKKCATSICMHIIPNLEIVCIHIMRDMNTYTSVDGLEICIYCAEGPPPKRDAWLKDLHNLKMRVLTSNFWKCTGAVADRRVAIHDFSYFLWGFPIVADTEGWSKFVVGTHQRQANAGARRHRGLPDSATPPLVSDRHSTDFSRQCLFLMGMKSWLVASYETLAWDMRFCSAPAGGIYYQPETKGTGDNPLASALSPGAARGGRCHQRCGF